MQFESGNLSGVRDPKQSYQPSLYDILGVTNTATIQQITKSFRKKAIKMHPDKGGDPDKYRALTEAYEVLKDPEKKDLYDKYGLEGVKLGRNPNDSGTGIFHPFESQFKGPKKCTPKLIEIKITLEEAYTGIQVQKQVTRLRACQDCEGKGGEDPVQCQKCTGRGFVEQIIMLAPGVMTKTPSPCTFCSAQGAIFEEEKRCKTCQGKKVVENTKLFKVKIDPGVPNQNDYIVPNEADEIQGLEAGDIYFRIQISSHQKFKRKGADLYTTKKIPLLHALTGITYKEILLNHELILISSPPFQIISNQEKRIIKNKGMPFWKTPQSRGHLVVTFQIQMPLYQQIEEKKLYRLAHLLKQPIQSFRRTNGTLKQLEPYTQNSNIRSQQEQPRAQCQPQ